MGLWTILGDIVVLLAASLLVGGLFSRFGQSPLVGYLLVGMLLGGPGSFHMVRSEDEIEAIAELGVALLLFSLGLEFSLERLKKLGSKPLLGGVLQVVLTTLLTAGGALAFGISGRGALAFGVMVALSSTAVVLRILMERGEMEMPHGRNSLAILLVQDMAVVPLAMVMTILGGDGTATEVAWDVGKLLVLATGLIAGLWILNKIAVLALGKLTLLHNRELTIIFAVVAGLGAAWAAYYAGISPALGAFVAGMLLGSSAFATQIRADISPLRVVLLTLFFGAAGMVADPIWILTHWYLVATVLILLTAGKLLVIWIILLVLGQTTRVAAATGLCLAQVGEFAFVLGTIGRSNGVVTEDMYALIVSVTIASFFLSVFLVPLAPSFGNWIARWLPSKQRPTAGEVRLENPPEVVIIGFGPAGQIAAQPLLDQDIHVVVIDLNRIGIRKAQQLGFGGALGDATQIDVLEHIRLNECKAVIITVPDHRSSLTILEHVRNEAPHAHVIVRARHQIHTGNYVTAGADAVAGDEEQVGAQLANHLSQWLRAQDAEDTPNKYR